MKRFLTSLMIVAAFTLAFPAVALAGGGGGGTAPAAPAAPTSPSSDVKEKVCTSLKDFDATACDTDNSTILSNVVQPIIQTLILVVGAVSVVVIVIGGLMYVLSAGDANNVKRAKDTIMYAAIGLLVALIAQTIVSFVIGAI